MKKISTLILLMCMGLVSVSAQIPGRPAQQNNSNGFGTREQNQQAPVGSSDSFGQRTPGSRPEIKIKHYNYELSIGPRAGVGMTSMSEGDELSVLDGNGMGFGAGLGINLRFGSKDKKGRPLDGQGLIGLGLELNYKTYAAGLKSGDDMSLSCFEAPILLQIYPTSNVPQLRNLYIELGATVSGVLSASPENMTITKDEQTFNHYYNRVETYNIGGIKGMDVKPTVGIGYRFSRNSANDGFYVNARYYMGSSDLAGNFPMKASSAELSIGYMFKCIGTKK